MKHLIAAIRITIVLTVLTGLIYPLLVLGLGHLLFARQANGSVAYDRQGRVVGSHLIGQPFTRPEYFHPRPSAAGSGYDAMQSGGTNLAATSRKLVSHVQQTAVSVRHENGLPPDAPLPVDAVTTSGSGLDPDISLSYAELQVPRIARARGVAEPVVRTAMATATRSRDLGFLGEPRLNVLEANLALDQAAPLPRRPGP
ncbi:MAG: K(+)-transporting ATPase subunit C [Candidatus Xenobia bacterium]